MLQIMAMTIRTATRQEVVEAVPSAAERAELARRRDAALAAAAREMQAEETPLGTRSGRARAEATRRARTRAAMERDAERVARRRTPLFGRRMLRLGFLSSGAKAA